MPKFYIGYQGKLPVRIENNRETIENDKFLKCDRIEEYEGQAQLVNGRILFNDEIITEARTTAISRIDSSTQSSILAGFEYTINNEYLHFSYQYEDQQNFSDTFNGIAMKKLMGVDSLPETIGWNGWKNHTSTNKGELVRLDLDIDSFLELYTKGALAHKSYHMTIHGERKKAIESAQSVEQINALLKEWSV